MRHDELSRIVLRSLAYAQLCAESVERDARGLLKQLSDAVEDGEAAPLAQLVDRLNGEAPAAQLASAPAIQRGSMHHG